MNLHTVLFGFWNTNSPGANLDRTATPKGWNTGMYSINLTSHLERSALNHSYGYASAADRPICFARLPQKSKSL